MLHKYENSAFITVDVYVTLAAGSLSMSDQSSLSVNY